jgi:hypothetical protein
MSGWDSGIGSKSVFVACRPGQMRLTPLLASQATSLVG